MLPTPWWRSLRTKIIAWSFIPAAIVLTAVAVVTYVAYQRVAEDLVVERDRELTRLTAGELAASLLEFPDLLADAARSFRTLGGDPAQLQIALAEARPRLVYFDAGVFVLDNLGRVAAAEPRRPDVFGQDWSTRPFFRQLVSGTGEPTFSNILADGPGGAEVIATAVAITSDRGQFVGALVGMFRLGTSSLSPFYGTLLRLHLERSGSAYLVDGSGRLIYSTDAGRVGSDFTAHPAWPSAAGGGSGAIRTLTSIGQDALASYGLVPNSDWILVVEENWANLAQSSGVYGQFLLALLALGVLLPAIVVTIGVRRITGPIAQLVEASRQVAGGHFGQTVAPNTGDELAELADQFNVMSARLKASYAQLEQRVEERTRELRALLDISRNVAAMLELQPLLGLILDQLGGVIEYQGATIFRLEGEDLTILDYRGPISAEQARRIRFSLSQAGANREVIQRREPVIIGDVRGDDRLAGAFRAAAGEQLNTTYAYLSCWLGVPLTSKDRVIGMLSIDHGTPGFYTEHHASLAMAFASQAAVAIENARLFEIEKRRAEQFRVINDVSQRVTSILSVGDILKHTVNLIRETFGYYHVHIGLIEKDVVVYQATAGVWQSDPDCQCCTDLRLRVGQDGVTGLAAGSGEPVLVPDVSLEPRYIPVQAGQTGSELVLPMKVKGQVVGVLNVESDRPNAFDASDVAVLQALANQVAVAIENARLYESEHRRADQFRVLAEVGQRITSILDVDRLLSQTVAAISEAFGYYHVGIALIEGDMAVYKVGAGALWEGQPAGFNPPRLKIGQEGLTGWVAASGAPLLVPDVSREPRYVRMEGSQTQSEVALPIRTKDHTIGVLDIQSDRLNAFDQSDLAVLQSLANQLAVAIENARLFETEQRRAEQLRIINEVGRRITSILTVDDLLAQTIVLIRESFQYYYASIGLIEGDEVVVKYGDPLRLKVGVEGIMGWVAAAGEPLRVPDVSREPRHVSSPSANRTQSELALPIKSRGQTIGVLDIESDRPDAFDESDVAVLQSLASQLGVAIENARLYEQAQQLAALEERQKLARELHDSVSQALYGIALGTRTARTLLSREPAAGAGVKALGEPLDYVLSLAEAGLAEMRALIFELRPESLEVEGLVAALTKHAASLRARHNLEVSANFGQEPELALPAKEALYRIAQEAFNNIAKHARATRVDVRLETNGDGVALEIGDDGVGFDPRGEFPGHLGLRSMRERAEKAGGTFAAESAPGQGTRIRVRFPLTAP
jgi:GAF domain-containing protein/two-component sensor histidine kinase/HAMP domain-containing protein